MNGPGKKKNNKSENMAMTIFDQEAYDEFQLDWNEVSKITQRVIKENKTMNDLKSYPIKLQKILWNIFVKHQECVKMTYHSCGIEGSTLTLEEVEEVLKPDYLKELEKAITDYEQQMKELGDIDIEILDLEESDETTYLLKNSKNEKFLKESIQEIEQGKTISYTIDELKTKQLKNEK